jgi:hypothetical protein
MAEGARDMAAYTVEQLTTIHDFLRRCRELNTYAAARARVLTAERRDRRRKPS